MKKLFILLFLISIWSCDTVKEIGPLASDVAQIIPEAVLNNMRDTYPDAKDINIKIIEVNKIYFAQFSLRDAASKAYQRVDGSFLNVSRNIENYSLIPAKIQQHLKQQYPTSAILKAEEILSKRQTDGYRIYVASNSGDQALEFDNSGGLFISYPVNYSYLSQGEIAKASLSYTSNIGLNLQENTYLHINEFDLPREVIKTLSNYDKHKIVRGVREIRAENSLYHMAITSSLELIDLIIDENGKLLSENYFSKNLLGLKPKSEKQENLPIEVNKYISSNYPGWTFIKSFAYANGEKVDGYLVVFQVGEDIFYLKLKAGGEPLELRKG